MFYIPGSAFLIDGPHEGEEPGEVSGCFEEGGMGATFGLESEGAFAFDDSRVSVEEAYEIWGVVVAAWEFEGDAFEKSLVLEEVAVEGDFWFGHLVGTEVPREGGGESGLCGGRSERKIGGGGLRQGGWATEGAIGIFRGLRLGEGRFSDCRGAQLFFDLLMEAVW